jgi:hypothetical protein
MFKIDKTIMQSLGFDLQQALSDFRAAKQAHRATVNVPAPTAHPFVEAAFAAGGFEVVESGESVQEPGSDPSQPPTPEMLLNQLEDMVRQARQIVATLRRPDLGDLPPSLLP